jgi:2'-5' RNA ligase
VRSARVRLFVALELPAAARDALVAWSARTFPPGLRTVPATDLHVTLCFLGEQPASDAAPIAGAVATAIGGTAPIELALGTTLRLPPRRPRVLAVSVTTPPAAGGSGGDGDDGGDDGALGALQSRVAAALIAGGWLVPETRRFLAHVTVARIRGGGSRPKIAGGLACVPPEERFAAGEVALIRSHLGAGPVRYERLGVFALSPPR